MHYFANYSCFVPLQQKAQEYRKLQCNRELSYNPAPYLRKGLIRYKQMHKAPKCFPISVRLYCIRPIGFPLKVLFDYRYYCGLVATQSRTYLQNRRMTYALDYHLFVALKISIKIYLLFYKITIILTIMKTRPEFFCSPL